jgi:hypothetical protein
MGACNRGGLRYHGATIWKTVPVCVVAVWIRERKQTIKIASADDKFLQDDRVTGVENYRYVVELRASR